MPITSRYVKGLIIGINYNGTDAELNGCINDALNMKKIFMHICGELRVMTEISENDNLIPTHENILKQLEWVTSDVKPGERVYIHYSGHGSYDYDRPIMQNTKRTKYDTNKYDMSNHDNNKHSNSNTTTGTLVYEEMDGRDETICPLDYATAGMISDDTLREYVDRLPKKSTLFAIFDCCHSGTMLDLRYNYISYYPDNGSDHHTVVRQNRKIPKTQANVYLISGCLDHQTSADAYINGSYQGALTYSFMNALYTEKKYTYNKLMRSMTKYLRDHNYSQIPKLSTGRLVNTKDILQ